MVVAGLSHSCYWLGELWDNYGRTMGQLCQNPLFTRVCVVLKKALEYLKTVNVFANQVGLNNANNC